MFFFFIITVVVVSISYIFRVGTFLGNLLPTVMNSMFIGDLIQKMYNEFPEERYIGVFQFVTPVLLIRDPELIKKITMKDFDHFADHTQFVSAETDPLWGKNLFAIEGERWRNLRHILSPAFTGSKMRTMFPLIDECAKQLVHYFKENNSDTVEVELKEVCTRYATDVIATTAFGIKCDSLKFKDNDFYLAAQELSDLGGLNRFKFFLHANYPTLAKWLNVKIIGTKVGNFFRSIINETIVLREQKNIIRNDLIHLLMLAKKGKLKYDDCSKLPEAGKTIECLQFLTNEDITAQAVVFFLGGFETVSSLMSFTGYELAVNPNIQQILKAEIKRTWREIDGKITYERLLEMKYLDMVLSFDGI